MRLAGILLTALLLEAPARAASYDALCGERRCTLRLDGEGLSAPGLFLPAGRIALWSTGGVSDPHSASGAGDLAFTVVGYDLAGRKATLRFRFLHPRPAARLRAELPRVTGLAWGQTRSLAELRSGAAPRQAPRPIRLEVIPVGTAGASGPRPVRLVVQPVGR